MMSRHGVANVCSFVCSSALATVVVVVVSVERLVQNNHWFAREQKAKDPSYVRSTNNIMTTFASMVAVMVAAAPNR